jgi:hypothetical protein
MSDGEERMTMRRRVNKRSQLILGIFVPVLLVGTAAYIYHVIAGSPVKAAEKPAARAKTTRARSTTGKPAAKAKPSDYTVIAQRNLFQPLIAPPKVTTSSPPPKPQPTSPPVNIPNVFAPPPMPEASLAAHSPAMDKIAVVGSVRVGDELYVLVEDLAKGETRYVKAGDSAFGYTVKAASIDDATLERDGQTYKVAMGEGKVGAPVRAGAGGFVPGRTFTPMGGQMMPSSGAPPMANPAFPGGIPDLANMSSEQRRQWFEQWRQSFQSMSPEQQEQARQQMRDYWRQRFEQGGFGSGRDGGDRRFNFDGNRGGFGGERRFSFGGSQPTMVGSSVTFGGGDAIGSGAVVYRYRDR